MAYELQGPTIRDDARVVRRIEITSPVARDKNTTSYYKVQIGIRKAGETDWVGSWSQAAGPLIQGVATSVLDDRHKDRRLKTGQSFVAKITKVGSPVSITGVSVTFHTEKVGGVRGGVSALIPSGGSVDPAIRAVVDRINAAGLSKETTSLTLVDEASSSASSTVTPAVYEDYDATAQTISSTTNVDGNVAITVTAPSGLTTYVHVTAKVVMYTTSSAGRAYLTIGDGTTDQNETEAYAATSQQNNAVTMLTDTITSDTTYTVRLKKATGANIEVDDQLITAIAVSA